MVSLWFLRHLALCVFWTIITSKNYSRFSFFLNSTDKILWATLSVPCWICTENTNQWCISEGESAACSSVHSCTFRNFGFNRTNVTKSQHNKLSAMCCKEKANYIPSRCFCLGAGPRRHTNVLKQQGKYCRAWLIQLWYASAATSPDPSSISCKRDINL